MFAHRRILSLIIIFTAVSILVTSTTILLLYDTAFEEEKARLNEVAQSQARLIEAIARFDSIHSEDYHGGAFEATLSQIKDAYENYKGFGETGEFKLARLDDDYIVFLLSHRHLDLDKPQPIPFNSELAEPMRKALSGQSGTIIGIDYRGELVLAAFEPVEVLNLGSLPR